MRKLLLILFITLCSTASFAQQSKLVSVSAAQTTIVRFYPNPATTIINFDFQKGFEQGYSLQIFNAILGRKMFEQTNLPERFSVNLNDFSRGIFIYQVRDRTGRLLESGKFQVAK